MTRWRTGPPEEFKRTKEVPWPKDDDGEFLQPQPEVVFNEPSGLDRGIGDTVDAGSFYEQLMVLGPGDDTTVFEQNLQLRDVIQDALDDLSERDRWVFDSSVSRGMGVRAIANELNAMADALDRTEAGSGAHLRTSKSQVYRIRQTTLETLREKLLTSPLIRDRLGINENE